MNHPPPHIPPDQFAQKLLAWYDPHSRSLPWKERTDAYGIWIAEVMLQQTVVSAVEKRYSAWMERFPDLHSLAESSLDDVLREWEGLGYYGRARNLHACARVLMEMFSGEFPSDYRTLRMLPGIGDYTASAILSIAFDQPVPAVDANVRRIVGRISGPDHEWAWAMAIARDYFAEALRQSSPRILTEAVMELGQIVCTAKSPTCTACPFRNDCSAWNLGLHYALPARRAGQIQRRYALALILEHQGEIYVDSPREGLFSGLKLLPVRDLAGSVGEAMEGILLDLSATRVEPVSMPMVTHHYTTNIVKLIPYVIRLEDKPVFPIGSGEWLRVDGLKRFAFPSAHRKIIDNWLKRNTSS